MVNVPSPMPSPIALAAFVLATGLTGCLHTRIGPRSLPPDRSAYSTAIADSWKEETLLNIVKARYLDPPVFVDVGNIVTNYTLTQNAAVGGTITPSGGSNATLGASVQIADNPTLTYTPLTGNAYIKGLVTPLSPELLFRAMQNGLPADSALFTTFISINGLRNQSVSLEGITPADPAFHRVRALMREIQVSGAVRLYVKENADKEPTRIIVLRTTDIPPEIRDDIAELRKLLHLNADATEFQLTAAPLPTNDREIAVQTRSIMELMKNMAAQVEVPSEDIAQHRAFPGFETGHPVPGVVPVIHIRSSKQKPDDAFIAIHYRNTWFRIDDDDLVSKAAFSELMELFSMIDTGSQKNQPVITIPVH
ncbi:MAG TPA: hypothetical protein VKB38_22510 [Terracidiphilus sp.]|nr:hypothetical protein [Terracidiphilus sp.]